MNMIVPPPSLPQAPNHPGLPEIDDDEDFVLYISRLADWLSETPPSAPHGFVLVECGAMPRHFPEYRVAEDTFYPGACMQCQGESTWRSLSEARCKLDHRKWRTWRVWGRLSSWLYTAGITPNGGSISYGRCEFCGVGRQHHLPSRWRGKRPYILGVRREVWECLMRGHRYRLHYPSGLCATCCPCPECGSIDQGHYTCEAA